VLSIEAVVVVVFINVQQGEMRLPHKGQWAEIGVPRRKFVCCLSESKTALKIKAVLKQTMT
jgi:hypothetical protein